MTKKKGPGICSNCLLWEKFGDECHVFWEDKKVCPSKVETKEEWNDQKELFKGK